MLAGTSATDAEVDAAVAINEEARLHALKVSLLGLAGLALLAIVPATRMPGRIRGELPEKLEPDDNDDIDERVPLNPAAQNEETSSMTRSADKLIPEGFETLPGLADLSALNVTATTAARDRRGHRLHRVHRRRRAVRARPRP